MRLDLTLQVDAGTVNAITSHQEITAFGHLGTHIDVMDQEFSLDNFKRNGKLIDVSSISEREIDIDDLKGVKIEVNDFVLFYTGFIDRVPYGTPEYFKTHPELSMQSIDLLIQKKVSLVGVDAPGLRRGPDHPKVDRRCAERNIFVVENLINLEMLSKVPKDQPITVYTLPANMTGMTGLPCRVIVEF